MLSYRPGSTFAHRLDPRSKLLVQFGLAIAAVAHPTLPWLVGTTAFALGTLAAARLSPLGRPALLPGRPRRAGAGTGRRRRGARPAVVSVDPALRSALHVGRILPVLLVSAAYLTSTPVRDTRAAVQRLIPGKPGQILGIGWRSSSDCSRWYSRTFGRCAMRSTLAAVRPARYGTAFGCLPFGRWNGPSTARTGSPSPCGPAVSRGTRRCRRLPSSVVTTRCSPSASRCRCRRSFRFSRSPVCARVQRWMVVSLFCHSTISTPVISNRAPPSLPSSIVTVQPWASAISATIQSPNPVPASDVE